jgi:hypothetical protein
VLVLAEALRIEKKPDPKTKGKEKASHATVMNQPRLPRKALIEIARKKDPNLRG